MSFFVVCPVLPFPNLYWWKNCLKATEIILDAGEHFQKMSFRNRYLIAGPDGVITLSIPVAEGRQQRRPMRDVLTDPRDKWQIRHWRTLQSAYNRSPYFEFYAPMLEHLFVNPYEQLYDFNVASIHALASCLGIAPVFRESREYISLLPEGAADLRGDFLCKDYEGHFGADSLRYYQVFEDRAGFLPNLSVLDLLFNEGPAARSLLLR
ncbi:MAG: WbqC family protein [Chitinophagaceae bacterium]